MFLNFEHFFFLFWNKMLVKEDADQTVSSVPVIIVLF